jgi:hypothetical protein
MKLIISSEINSSKTSTTYFPKQNVLNLGPGPEEHEE